MDKHAMSPKELDAFASGLPAPPAGWKVVVNETTPWALVLLNNFDSEKITIKWDGCAHYLKSYNGVSVSSGTEADVIAGAETDYLHICDLDHWAVMLQELAAYARSVGVYTEP